MPDFNYKKKSDDGVGTTSPVKSKVKEAAEKQTDDKGNDGETDVNSFQRNNGKYATMPTRQAKVGDKENSMIMIDDVEPDRHSNDDVAAGEVSEAEFIEEKAQGTSPSIGDQMKQSPPSPSSASLTDEITRPIDKNDVD